VLEVGDKASRAIPGASRDGCHSAPGAKSSVENRQCDLTRTAEVLEAVHSGGLVYRQVLLRVLELLQETVFKYVDLVHVAGAPDEMGLVADISDLEHVVPSKLPLDAKGIIYAIRSSEVGIESRNVPGKSLIGLVDDRLVGSGCERERRSGQGIGNDI